jgi:hypothetical protein
MSKRVIKAWLLIITGMFLLGFAIRAHTNPQTFGDVTVQPLDQWTSTSSPSTAITQRTFGKILRLSGYNCSGNTNGGALTTDANGVVSCSNDDGGAGGSSDPNVIYLATGGTTYYVASSTATNNLSWRFNNGFVSTASSTIVGPLSFGTAFSTSTGALNHSLLLKTDQVTDTNAYLLGLQYLAVSDNNAKANIAFINATGSPIAWIAAHDYLAAGNPHFHMSFETKERTTNQLQSRLEIEHTCDGNECDVATASGANLRVGSGGDLTLWDGDMFTQGAFDLFPNNAWNSTVALRVGTTSVDKLLLAGLGTSNMVIDDNVHATGNITASGTTMGVDSSGTATHYITQN